MNKRKVITNYQKLPGEVLLMLKNKYPNGYAPSDFIRFEDHKKEVQYAIMVDTNDTIYLVKVPRDAADNLIDLDEDDATEGRDLSDENLVDDES